MTRETPEARETRVAEEEAERALFIQERFGRCWNTFWQVTERDENGRARHFRKMDRKEFSLTVLGVPTQMPRRAV